MKWNLVCIRRYYNDATKDFAILNIINSNGTILTLHESKTMTIKNPQCNFVAEMTQTTPMVDQKSSFKVLDELF